MALQLRTSEQSNAKIVETGGIEYYTYRAIRFPLDYDTERSKYAAVSSASKPQQQFRASAQRLRARYTLDPEGLGAGVELYTTKKIQE